MGKDYFDESQSTAGEVSADVAAAADLIADQAPEVQRHAIESHQQAEAANVASVEKDASGVPFDASKHTGSKLKSGAWREKKSRLAPAAKKTAAKETVSVDMEANARAAGAAAAGMMFGTCTMIMGGEWQPRTKAVAGYDENDVMGKAFGDYFVAKGITDFPPGITLAVMCLGYFTARLQMPETKSRFQRLKYWFGIRMAARKLRKEFAKRGIVARVEIRDGQLLVDGKPPAEHKPATK